MSGFSKEVREEEEEEPDWERVGEEVEKEGWARIACASATTSSLKGRNS